MRLIRTWRQTSHATRLRIQIVTALTVAAVVLSLAGIYCSGDWSGLMINLGTGLAGSVITFLLIDRLLAGQEHREAEKRDEAILKTDLVAKLGSSVEDIAVAAAEELSRRGWSRDGSLNGIYLVEAQLAKASLSHTQMQYAKLNDSHLEGANLILANLQGANMDGCHLEGAFLQAANLHRASLVMANLTGADLRDAELQNADLITADLRQANLDGAKLEGAYLSNADLRRASLRRAELRGAFGRGIDLRGANLQGANMESMDLAEAQFDSTTTLPDGNPYTSKEDVERFTRSSKPMDPVPLPPNAPTPAR